VGRTIDAVIGTLSAKRQQRVEAGYQARRRG
jgi:hypothetical protein